LLKDEPAILAWETGNELFIKGEPFTNWTSEIATFMKHEVGIKQLVMDGRANVGAGVDDEALSTESDVDIFTDHYYKAYDAATSTLEKDAQITAVQYGKVFVVGEYGPKGAKSLEVRQQHLCVVRVDCSWFAVAALAHELDLHAIY